MLHDPSHYTPLETVDQIEVSDKDRNILRGFAERKAAAAGDPATGDAGAPSPSTEAGS